MKPKKTIATSDMDVPPVYGYHIFPPFIDAYKNSFYTNTKEPLDIIKCMMKAHAYEWGSDVIGRSVLGGKEIPKYNNKIVLCCAYTYVGEDNQSDKQYLIVVDELCDDWMNKLLFIEGKVTDEWDVT